MKIFYFIFYIIKICKSAVTAPTVYTSKKSPFYIILFIIYCRCDRDSQIKRRNFFVCTRRAPQAILLCIVKAFNNKQVKITLCIINMLSGRGENLRIKRMRFCLCEAKAAGNTCRIVKAFNNAQAKRNSFSRRFSPLPDSHKKKATFQGRLFSDKGDIFMMCCEHGICQKLMPR